MQLVGDVQAMPANPWAGLPLAVEGFTVVSITQELPFQDSARVRFVVPLE